MTKPTHRVLRDFSSTLLGNCSADDLVTVPRGLALQWEGAGMIEALEKKPGGDAGAAPSSASPADPALNTGNATTYETKPLPLSPRTPASAPCPDGASSTDAMKSGGSTTTAKSAKPGTKGGRKTGTRRQGTRSTTSKAPKAKG